jgi:CTP:molybdopterin cytidylyltransferase MocA
VVTADPGGSSGERTGRAPGSGVHAVLLAAGEGKRFGGPKALATADGEPFLVRVARAARDGGSAVIWAVVRPGADAIARLAREAGAIPVENPDPDRGMFSSVQAGLEAALAAAPPPRGVLIYPVDYPRVSAGTVAALLAALAVKPATTWAQPTHDGTPGHPIAIDAVAARALLHASPDTSLRDALHALGLTRHPVPVLDPGVLTNVNRPGD